MDQSFLKEALGRRVNDLFRLSMMNFRNEMKKLGVGAGDYPFIVLLFINEGVSQDELSRRMRVDKSYTARALAKLEKTGMVERRPDPDEHRIKRVFLGRKARDIEMDFFLTIQNWHKVLGRGIDPERMAIIRSGMDQMIKNAEAYLGLEEFTV